MNGDHAPTYVVKKQAPIPTVLFTTIVGRSYKTYDVNSVNDYVSNTDWDLDNVKFPLDCYDLLIKHVRLYLDAHHPVKTTKIAKNRPKVFTRVVQRLVKKKGRFLRKSRKVVRGVYNRFLPTIKKLDKSF